MLGYFGVSIVYQTLDLDYMIFSMWSLHMCIHTADLCFIQSLIQRTFVESTQNLTLEKSWVTFCLLVMSQAPQHLRSYMMQVTCDGCLAPQPICSAIYIDSRMSKPIQSHKEKWGGVGRKGGGGGVREAEESILLTASYFATNIVSFQLIAGRQTGHRPTDFWQEAIWGIWEEAPWGFW